MTRPSAILFILAAASMTLSGQRVLVYSEFQRVGPDGNVIQTDRVESRREILSPAVARNAFTTFRVAVEVPNGSPYTIHIAQNPEDSVKVAFYQEEYSRLGAEWVPDRVKPIALPVSAQLSQGQKVQSYLLDVFVPAEAKVGRFRLEVQMNVLDQWVIYPLEVRVQWESAPSGAEPRGPLPDPSARADAVASAAVRSALCGRKTAPGESAVPLDRAAAFSARNVLQDLGLWRERRKSGEPAMADWQLIKSGGWASKDELCKTNANAPAGAEWWLRARGYLYQGIAVK
ncbi:MAG: hypothetical protein HY821_16850 [Acidobacteria bacterium]|nr:hypothetical protein [Acidobacteriota bacterium]